MPEADICPECRTPMRIRNDKKHRWRICDRCGLFTMERHPCCSDRPPGFCAYLGVREDKRRRCRICHHLERRSTT